MVICATHRTYFLKLVLGLLLTSCISANMTEKIDYGQSSDSLNTAIDSQSDTYIAQEFPGEYKFSSGLESLYTVRPGETLMIIAFNVYGDYRKWQEIYQRNKDTIGTGHSLEPGMVLYLKAPKQEIARPTGLPYLVKKGDSLSIISNKVYGDLTLWPKLWENNKSRLRSPNRIFTGFILFYEPEASPE